MGIDNHYSTDLALTRMAFNLQATILNGIFKTKTTEFSQNFYSISFYMRNQQLSFDLIMDRCRIGTNALSIYSNVDPLPDTYAWLSGNNAYKLEIATNHLTRVFILDAKMLVAVYAGIILCMRTASETRHYHATSSLIGWAHKQNDPCIWCVNVIRYKNIYLYISMMRNVIICKC